MTVIIVSKANRDLLLAPYGFENEELAMEYVLNSAIGISITDLRIIPLPILQAPLTMVGGEVTTEPIYITSASKLLVHKTIIRGPEDVQII